jgi:hypothetical protein
VEEEVTDEVEKQAVRDGLIAGTVYKDGSVWADSDELQSWRMTKAQD